MGLYVHQVISCVVGEQTDILCRAEKDGASLSGENGTSQSLSCPEIT